MGELLCCFSEFYQLFQPIQYRGLTKILSLSSLRFLLQAGSPSYHPGRGFRSYIRVPPRERFWATQ